MIPLYLIEGLASAAGNLMILGMYFYTRNRLGWSAQENLLLASVQGIVYMAGALACSRVAARLGRRRTLIGLHAAMAVVAAIAWQHPTGPVITAVVLAYTFFSAAGWPALESLVSAGADPHTMSRRIGIYNLVWAGAGWLAVAVDGTLIAHRAQLVFQIPLVFHAAALVMLILLKRRTLTEHARLAPEEQLLAVRSLAMRLSRVALPATYAVIYALGAIMPSLPILRSFPLALQTIVAAAWMAARFGIFLLLGFTSWWHTRPRLLVAATIFLLIAFLGVTVRISDLGLAAPASVDRASMILWQIVLGVSLGMIYSGSLYFGMVLSDGATEYGGYHEALIGLGQVVGPGVGALAHWQWPGQNAPGIAAVAGVLGLSVIMSLAVSLRRANPQDLSIAARGP